MDQTIISWILFYGIGLLAIVIGSWQTYRLWKYSCAGCSCSVQKKDEKEIKPIKLQIVNKSSKK